MQDKCANETRTDNGHILSQRAIILVDLVLIEAYHILKEQNDEHTLAESSDQDVDQDCGSS